MSISPESFAFVADLVRRRSAIQLTPGKEYLVESRLLPLARRRNVSVDEYVRTQRTRPDRRQRDQKAQHQRRRDRHHGEGHQRVGRKERHAPVVMIGEAHLLLGEELVMHQGVPVVDRAKRLDLRGAVHDEAVDPPFEEIRGQERHRHDQQLPPAQAADIGEIDRQRGKPNHVDDEGM